LPPKKLRGSTTFVSLRIKPARQFAKSPEAKNVVERHLCDLT
jgi:hypothetical protein